APPIGVEERRLPPDAGKDLLLAVLPIAGCDGPARPRDRAPVASAQLLEGGLVPVGDRTQQLAVARPRRSGGRSAGRSSERLSHHPARRTPFIFIMPFAMFGCPFGSTISHRPPCILACWHSIFPGVSAA